MPVIVRCPTTGCQAMIRVPEERLGRAGRCPRCGVEIVPIDNPGAAEPASFGRFRIVKRLGKGGMGTVFLAEDPLLGRRVALKIPRLGGGNREAILERFRREARAAARFDNPHLCRIDKLDRVGSTDYMVMPYLEGRSLADCLEPWAPHPQKAVAALVRTLALAMADAHALGVIHRDLKPSNIMVVRGRGPVIVDFGISLRLDETEGGQGDACPRVESGAGRYTRAGAILGTVGYLAPEQVGGDLAAMGPSSDVYSLGMILHELLTGRLPFEGPPAIVLGLIAASDPDPPSSHRPGLHPGLDAICRKAMARRIGDRYASMLEFAGALGRYLRNEDQAGLLEPDAIAEGLGGDTLRRLVDRLLDGESEEEEGGTHRDDFALMASRLGARAWGAIAGRLGMSRSRPG